MDTRLRIAVISAHSCPVGTLGTKDTGGMSVYTVEIARELGMMGHYVDVFTRVHDMDDRMEVALGENANLVHIEAGEAAKIDKLSVYSLLPEFSAHLEDYRRQKSVEYDLIYSHYWLSTVAGEHLARLWDVPHITMFHTLGAVKNETSIGNPEPSVRTETESELARSVSRIIAPTEREKAAIINHYGADAERISVVPCGVNPDLFRPLDREEARQKTDLGNGRIVLYAGRIDPLKGIPNLLEAMPLLRQEEDTTLVIVGGGENNCSEIRELKELAHELGIDTHVVFTGAVKQELMPYYYSAADVCVMPSYYESFGLVALEALSCGTPVVASDVGDLKNIVVQGETGYVVEENDAKSLAEKIDLVLKTGPYDSDKVRETVMDYAWVTIAESLTHEFNREICQHNVCVS